jgi:hypothetical protein
MDCDKTNSEYEFYIAIKKIGESRIKIYKNPEFIYLSKFSDFKAAFWIRDVKDISSCFKFNNIYHKKPFLSNAVDEYWDTLHYYTYGYKSINMAEYNFSNIYSFKDFITFTSAENIIMPFYSNDNVCDINRFISNNYRLKNINWNEFTIKANHIEEFITYSALEGIDLDMKIIKGAKSLQRFFEFDDLTNNNIKNFDTSQVTEFVGVLANTLGNEIAFIKNWNTSQLITMNHFISNNDIEKLDLSMWNKARLVDIAFGFYKCRNLKYIDLSGYVKVVDDCNILGLFWGLNSLEAKELKEKINNSSDKLIKDLSNIFSATKFDKNNNISKGNILLNESMDSMANEINTLLNIVNKLKVKELQLKNVPDKFIDIIKEEEMLKEYEKVKKKNCKYLEDIYQNINNTLMELKKTEFYILAKKIIDE